MSFVLKIVEGPNKGAEIALVGGVAVMLGKSDDCDIVLADQTMPEAPLKFEATDEGVAVDGEPIEPYHVKTVGATSFAIGPADAAWGELVWPKAEVETTDGDEPKDEAPKKADAKSDAPAPAPEEKPAEDGKKKRRGCGCGCLVAILASVLAVFLAMWIFRERVDSALSDSWPQGHRVWRRVASGLGMTQGGASEEDEAAREAAGGFGALLSPLMAIAEKYGLDYSEDDGEVRISGNFKTRAERLKATAEAYAEKPGVILDLSDDESFRAAAEDAVFTLTEGSLKVLAATNRNVALGGVARSATSLKKILDALNADLPKLQGVDLSEVVLTAKAPAVAGEEGAAETDAELPAVAAKAKHKKSGEPDLPVCGILTTPYPCLVMRNGMRVMEGATVGENVIMKIEADSVTVTNSAGRFTWKP